MKLVTLFRHAKSDWKDDSTIADFDRPLSDRGLQAAPAMGEALQERGLLPDAVICSPSIRTRQTFALASAGWAKSPGVSFDARLYEAGADDILAILHTFDDAISHLMIVGHNPGLQALATCFLPQAISAARGFADTFPTASVAVFGFDIGAWHELAVEGGTLKAFITPKQLLS